MTNRLQESDKRFKKILIISLGQLGDVILSLPALAAVREKFKSSQITALVGKPAVGIVEISQFADEIIFLDRRQLKTAPKLRSILELFRFARGLRRQKFDLVVDLHSFYETNLLAFLSGAPSRIFANRDRRSLDLLSHFPSRPPLEDRTRHQADRYLSVLEPLGIKNADRIVKLKPRPSDVAEFDRWISETGADTKTRVGLFLGAGHPTRRWDIANFAQLAERLSKLEDLQVYVFLGPEERSLRPEVSALVSKNAVITEELSLTSFFGAIARLDVFVCGDTGPAHLAALAGVPMVLLAEKHVPTIFYPLTHKLKVLARATINEITVNEVYSAVLTSTEHGAENKDQPKQNK